MQQQAMPEVPCLACEGWMRVGADGHWACSDCGARSEEAATGEPHEAPAPTRPQGAEPVTFAQAAGPAPPARWTPPRRSFGRCLLYGVLSLGFYFAWYQYQVPREVDERSGQVHHAGLYVAALGASATAAVLDASMQGLDVPGMRVMVAVVATVGSLCLTLYWGLEASHLRTALARVGSSRRPNAWALPTFAASGLLVPFLSQGALVVCAFAALAFGLLAFLAYHDNVEAYWKAQAIA